MRIALFDSGIGGLTVLSHARRVLPSEEFLFFADRDHVPYGTKSVSAVRGYVREAFRFLVERQKADAVVVACNTATSVAVEEMRQLYDVPIIGMEPAVKKALAQDPDRRVLVTATPITVNGEKLRRLLWNTLSPYELSKYSAIVLGCTHFNYFKDTMRRLLPKTMGFVDGNEGTVEELARRTGLTTAAAGTEMAPCEFFESGRPMAGQEALARIESYLARAARMEQIV